jgi:hypothetical protein
MIKKKYLIIFIFLCIFLISSVSAAEIENETTTIESTPQESVSIQTQDVDMYYKDGTRFIAEIRDADEIPIENASVTFDLNNVSYSRKTNDNGQASIALNLNSGKYIITTKFNEITISNTVNIKSTIQSSDVVKIYKNSTQYYAKFLDVSGEDLENTAVTFNINGVFYTRMTDENGIAKLNINLAQGKYILTAIHPKNGEMISNNITVLPTITNNNNVIKYYRNASKYSVTILGKDGFAVGSGHTVEFNINGVYYNRQTDIYGIASLNLNLRPGDYIITAQYDGCRVSNSIRILPTLTANDIEMGYNDGTKFKAHLVDGTGLAAAYEKVKFNINGVFYTRTTDENGIASLNINLMVGTYIITSEHNGLAISNKIIIKESKIGESVKNTNFTYEIKIPNYVNVTCPYVFENSAYTIKSGIDGIIRMEKNQLIEIQIGHKNYLFSTSYMPEYSATYLGGDYYLLPFDNGQIQHSYKLEKLAGNGIILHRSLNYTHFIYRNNCSSNIEQFGAYIDKGLDYSEVINYVQNGESIAKIKFQTMSFDEMGLKYSLSKEYGYSIYDFDYKSYGDITNGNIDQIKFAKTGKNVIFDYFGMRVVGYITEEDIMTKFNSINCIEFEKEELITYGLSKKYKGDLDVLHSFAIVNKKVGEEELNEWISKENEYTTNVGFKSIYMMFITSLNTIYLSDKLSDELSKDNDVKWSRSSNTVVLGAMNWEDTFQHILTPDMGRLVSGNNESNIIKFRFANSILLSKIEEESLRPIAEDSDVNITSVFDDVFKSISSYKVSVVYYNNTAIISDENGNSSFIIDLNSGLVTPLAIKDGFAYKGIAISRDCGLCSINSMLKSVVQYVNNIAMQFNGISSFVNDNIQPLTSMTFKGALLAKGFVGAIIGGSLTIGLSIVGTAASIQSIGVYYVEKNVEDNELHTAYDHITFTRPGYLQNTKIYNIPLEDGSVDYIEIPINKDNSYDRENVKYISKGNVRTLTRQETYNYFTEEGWSPYTVPQKYWR